MIASPFTATHPATGAAGPERPIRVLVVDDHPAVRLGVRRLIEDQPDMAVVAEAHDAEQALSALLRLGRPSPGAAHGRPAANGSSRNGHGATAPRPVDVAVVDHQLGGERTGLWLTRELKDREATSPRVLVYSAFADDALALAAIVAGADGLLGKRAIGNELCAVIRQLARGRSSLPAIAPPVARAVAAQLAPRDQAILGMLLHGVPDTDIAARLRIDAAELASRRREMLRTLAAGTPLAGGAAVPGAGEAGGGAVASSAVASSAVASGAVIPAATAIGGGTASRPVERARPPGGDRGGAPRRGERRRTRPRGGAARIADGRLAAARIARKRLAAARRQASGRPLRYGRLWREDRYLAA